MGEKICVLVTGVGGRSFGHQILHALLLLGDKYKVIATDAEPFSFGLYQVANRHIVPLASHPRYLETILEIVKKEKVDILLPGTQPEVYALAEGRDIFAKEDCHVLANPFQVVKLCDHKENLSAWLEKNGFAEPVTAAASNWQNLASKVGFPLVGKPTQNTGGSRNVAILKDEHEVENYLSESQKKNDEVFFQQYVGSPESEYTVGVMVSKTGQLIDSIVMHRKLIGLSLQSQKVIEGKYYALSSGYSQGFIVKNPLIQSSCEDLAMKIGARGPMNIQCRLENDKVFIFEVHPRFSGTTSTRADVGFNEPDVLIRNWLFDENFGRLNYRTEVAAIRAFQNIIVPMSTIQSMANFKNKD